MNELDTLVESARQSFVQALTPADLENAKALYLGKAGRITELMKGMAQLSVDEKKSRGAAINLAKQAIEAALTGRRQALAALPFPEKIRIVEMLRDSSKQIAAAAARQGLRK